MFLLQEQEGVAETQTQWRSAVMSSLSASWPGRKGRAGRASVEETPGTLVDEGLGTQKRSASEKEQCGTKEGEGTI